MKSERHRMEIAAAGLDMHQILAASSNSSVKSRVLGGDVDFNKFNIMLYFENAEVELNSSDIKFEEKDGVVTFTNILPGYGSISKKTPFTMTGEASPADGSVVFKCGQSLAGAETVEGANVTYILGTADEEGYAIYADTDEIIFTYDSTNDCLVSEDVIAVLLFINGQFAQVATYSAGVNLFASNAKFKMEAQSQTQQGYLEFPLYINKSVQSQEGQEVTLYSVLGLSPIVFGGTCIFGEMKDGNLLCIYNNSVPAFNQYGIFQLASFDENTGDYRMPVVAYKGEIPADDTENKDKTLFTIPALCFYAPLYNVDLLYELQGLITGDGLIYMNKDLESGVEDVVAAPAKANAQYYNIQGMEVNNPTKGQLLIEKTGDTSRKIIF